MPKVVGDPLLQIALRDFVAASGGKVAVAARLLGIEKTLLWRYHTHGVALPKNEQLIRDALRTQRDKPMQASAAPDSNEVQKSEIPQPDIARLRRFLHHLMEIVDAYEASLLASASESQPASVGLSQDGLALRSPR